MEISDSWWAKYVSLKNATAAALVAITSLMVKAIEENDITKAMVYLHPFFWALGVAYLILCADEIVPGIANWIAKWKASHPPSPATTAVVRPS